MSRTTKQIVYTIGYLLFFGFIFLLIWTLVSKQDPTCFDAIKNQNETGVDCGGSCISCELKDIQPIEFLGYTAMPLRSGRVSFLFHIQNPNQTHHASPFSYTIHLFDENDIERETLEGASSLYAGEDGYVYEGSGTYSNPKRVEFEINSVDWKSSDAFSSPILSVHNMATVVENGIVRVKGQVENSSSFDAENVHLIAVVSGEYEEDIFASEMILTRVLGLRKEQFSIAFPNDPEIAKRLKTNQTRIIVQGE